MLCVPGILCDRDISTTSYSRWRWPRSLELPGRTPFPLQQHANLAVPDYMLPTISGTTMSITSECAAPHHPDPSYHSHTAKVANSHTAKVANVLHSSAKLARVVLYAYTPTNLMRSPDSRLCRGGVYQRCGARCLRSTSITRYSCRLVWVSSHFTIINTE